jgi:hypothetical protein
MVVAQFQRRLAFLPLADYRALRRIRRMDFLPTSTAPPLELMDYIGPAIGAALFVIVMALVAEPTRRSLNAVLVAGASGVYLSGGFGVWELVYPVVVTPVVYRGLQSYRYIGLAWLMHAAWDLPHHLWGHPIWPFMPTSSFGCFVFDSLIAVCFFAGATDFVHRRVFTTSGTNVLRENEQGGTHQLQDCHRGRRQPDDLHIAPRSQDFTEDGF